MPAQIIESPTVGSIGCADPFTRTTDTQGGCVIFLKVGTAPSPLTRRRFLQVGGAAGALLAVGGAIALRGGGRAHYRSLFPQGVTPANMSDKAFGVLCVLCDRVVAGPLSARDARLAERIDRELAFHPPRMQRDVELALVFLEHGGLLHAAPTRFTRMAPDAQDALLQQMLEGLSFERQAISSLKLLALFFLYADDRTWKGIHYDGPQGVARKRPPADSNPMPG